MSLLPLRQAPQFFCSPFLLSLIVVTACGDGGNSPFQPAAAGGGVQRGGSAALGGSSSDGGRPTGGLAAGGSQVSGGAPAGGSATGGSTAGGGPASGGASTGGTGRGGTPAGGTGGTGGQTSGGTPAGGSSAGGSSAGGSSAGGSSAGGNASGGQTTGGTAAGGSSAGGSSSGGNASGGQATGGTAAGGSSTGGNPSGGSAQSSGGSSGGASSCANGRTACGTSCVDLKTDLAHCGSCNAPCSGGRTCVSGACQCPSGGCTALPAFPGADGAAAGVSGGRGGSVYHVTRLDTDSSDVNPGTLRYGLTQVSGPCTIVFEISGVFSLGRTAVSGWNANGNGWDTASRLNIPADVTLAGQTAPGPVIIMGGVVKPGGTNIILRNITFAPGYGNRGFDTPDAPPAAGDFPDAYVYDALDISGQNVMIDHITAVYATDETISMNELANNVTVQYSTIAQGQNYPQADAEASGTKYTGHALGSLLQAGSNAKISILHNLHAHLKGRLPRVGTEASVLTVSGVGAYNDFRNNVFYNWLGTAGTGASGQPSQNNFVANFYLAGPGGDDASGGTSTAITTAGGGTSIFNGSDATLTKVYHSGNVKDTNKDADPNDTTALANGDFGSSSFQSAAFTQTPYGGVTETATAAFARVLDYAGARWWNRGAIDQRLVAETRSGKGKIVAWADDPFDGSTQEGTEWRALVATTSTSRPTGFDTDSDGMPNDWETAHGLDPSVADNNGDFDADGYTNLEEYINELAAWPAATTALFEHPSEARYAELSHWRLESSRGHWEPSRYDRVRVSSGTALVDAVGQHAGVLEVAGRKRSAALRLRSGWLEVVDDALVGSYLTSSPDGTRELHAGTGRVEQTGGSLRVGRSVILGGPRGARGQYRLSGGELSTPALLAGAYGGEFSFAGGVLRTSKVDFSLTNAGGVLSPGLGVGELLVQGDFNQRDGTLEVEIGEARSDTLVIEGKARLGGELRLRWAEGRAPKAGDHWTLITARGGIRGQFTRIPAGYFIEVTGDRAILHFGPSPSVELASRERHRECSG